MPIHPFKFSDDTYELFSAKMLLWAKSAPQIRQTAADVLEYSNLAQKHLEMKQILNPLVTSSVLTFTDDTAPCPTDMRKFIDMRADADADGILDYPYVINRDFEFVRSFAKLTGWTISLKMHIASSRSLYEPTYLIYQKALEELTGVGTEYLFFPKSLMSITYKMLLIRDCGDITNEYHVVVKMFDEIYGEFMAMCNTERNNKPYRSVPDANGNPISYSLERFV
jgi:hypothetical protein